MLCSRVGKKGEEEEEKKLWSPCSLVDIEGGERRCKRVSGETCIFIFVKLVHL
jgi:hypothetical protein